jgi:glycosyltransferase involved in cell wall biosynthesis
LTVETRAAPSPPVRERPRTADRVRTRSIRVAHIVTNFTAGAGGITLREVLAVDPARYTSTIVAPAGGTLIPRAEAAGVEVIQLQQMATGRKIYPWDDARAIREMSALLECEKFDLVHTHAAKAGAVGRIAAHRAGVPTLVHTLHGFPFNEFQSPVTRNLLRTIERRLARITDYFITDGTNVAAEAVRLKLAYPERIRALVSPVDAGIERVTPASRRQARQTLGLPEDAKVIGTVARVARQKGPRDMLSAVAGLERSDLYTVWIGDGDLLPEMRRLVERRGLADRFLLVGARDDVLDLLPAFDIFALSSLWEGLPCSLIEAMTCGLPVVATAVNSVPEIVFAAKTGLLARPGDPGSLRRALAYMLDHPEEAARMAEAGNAHITAQSRPDLLGLELMEIYETAMAFGRASRGGSGT